LRPMFQSTHPHGVRLQRLIYCIFLPWFQSTHPHGVRHLISSSVFASSSVSIHAPARGATLCEVYLLPCHRFNPRTRTGCDDECTAGIAECDVSIHAPARGATTGDCGCFWINSCFNPRTRTGCDIVNLVPLKASTSFNPRTRTGCDGGK